MTPDQRFVPSLDTAIRDRREADLHYNEALTALDRALVEAHHDGASSREQLERLATALIVFLQQITAFVETKDRELMATSSVRFAAIDRQLESVDELRTQVTVLQRSRQAVERTIGSLESCTINLQPACVSSASPTVSPGLV